MNELLGKTLTGLAASLAGVIEASQFSAEDSGAMQEGCEAQGAPRSSTATICS